MEAGDGRRAQTVYLKPKKKVPAPVLASLAPLPPRANFSSSSAPFLSSWFSRGQAEEPSWVSLPSQPAEAARFPLSLSAG